MSQTIVTHFVHPFMERDGCIMFQTSLAADRKDWCGRRTIRNGGGQDMRIF